MTVRARAVRLFGTGLDAALSALGHHDQEKVLARREVVDWARARVRAGRNRSGVMAGLGVVVTARGRAELLPIERALAGPDELTVELLASAISPGTERAQWLRLPNAQPDFPYLPGYSGAGRVLAAGPGMAGPVEGQLVAVARVPHASVSTVPAAWATPVPDGVDVAEAALVYLAIISGYGVRRAALQPGDHLCVVGAGPIGALAQRLAALREPGRVTVIAAGNRRETAALAAGADAFMTAAESPDHVGADAVIEATGDPRALATAVAAARSGGTVVLLGSPRGLTPGEVLTAAQAKALRLVGAHVSALAAEARRDGSDPFQELARTFLAALASGALAARDLVGDALDPREAQLVYRRLARGEIDGGHFDWRLLPSAERVRRRSLAAPPRVRPRAAAELQAPAVERPPAKARLRFALVGCGDVGLHNARAISGARGAELVACHDPVASLAAAACERFGGSAAAGLDEALDPGRVDAVFLSVPHDLHTPLVEQAAAAGLHVVVEKPLANDLADAQRAVEAAESAGVTLSVCFPYRYEPAMRCARQLVAAGALGEPRGVTVAFHADKPESYWVGGFSGRAHSGWRSSAARAGGGVLIMNLTHYVDFIRYVSGLEAVRVAALSRAPAGAEVEDGIAIAAEFDGGALASISGSGSTRGVPHSRFELWGELGTLRLEPDPAIYSETAAGGLPPGRWCALPEHAEIDPRTVFVEQFAAAVLEGRPADVSAADGLAVQAFVDAAYRSAEQGFPAEVSLRTATRAP